VHFVGVKGKVRVCLRAGSILTSGFNSPYFTRVIFQLLVDFLRFGSILGIFRGRFSCFCRFFKSEVRYTRTQDGTLMSSPSPKRVEAGQLGSKGCRIWAVCPPCGFGTKPFARLTQMACRAAMSIRKTCYRDSPYSPYTLILTLALNGPS
jgi:hypothetical protein